MNYRTLQKSVNSGVFAAQKISDKLWCFDLDELARNNPAALPNADPSK
jgi:hypothetical protein